MAGGVDINWSSLASAELYQPGALTPAGLVSITVSPVNPSISAGTSQPLTATGTFSDPSTQTIASVTWTSSDSTIVTITNDATNYGNSWGMTAGSATISACAGSLCASTGVTVTPGTSSLPQISSLSPTSGAAGSWVALMGMNLGASQGHSRVLFGGVAAGVVSWSDTTVIAVVPPSLQSGQSVAVLLDVWTVGSSNTVTFTVSVFGSSGGYRASPQSLSMLVGESRTISVTDASGNPVTGLAWTTNNSSVVSLSTDDPPLITALAPGNAIVFAGGMPIPITVYAGSALPPGTPIWSLPMGISGAPGSVVPAVPSSSGVDLFAVDTNAGNLNALKTDATIAWIVPLAQAAATQVIPDFSGGAFITEPYSYTDTAGSHSTHILERIDPNTHQLTTLYTFADTASAPSAAQGPFSDVGATEVAIPHPSGVVFVQSVLSTPDGDGCPDPGTGNLGACHPTVSLLDPSSSQTLATISLENSTWTYSCQGNDCPTVNNFTATWSPKAGQMIVAGDGNAYVPYFYSVETENEIIDGIPGVRVTSYSDDIQTVSHFMVLHVSPDGTYAKTELASWTGDEDMNVAEGQGGWNFTCSGTLAPADAVQLYAITNGSVGAAIFSQMENTPCDQATGMWDETAGTWPSQITYVSQGGMGSQVNLPADTFVQPTLQREDGSYIATDWSNVYAIGVDGSVLWQQALGSASTPLYATADGGVIVTSTPSCPHGVVQATPCTPAPLGTLYTVDQNGNVKSQEPDTGAKYSWKAAYTIGGDPTVQEVTPDFDLATIATTPGAVGGGNLTGNGFSLAHHTFGLVFCGPEGGGDCPSNLNLANVNFSYLQGINDENHTQAADFSVAHPEWVATIKNAALDAYRAAFASLPAIVALGYYKPGAEPPKPPYEHTVYVDGSWTLPIATDNPCPSEAGKTLLLNPPLSKVHYMSLMCYAASVDPDLPKPRITDLAGMQKEVAAIGTGIGNVAAHETGWQYSYATVPYRVKYMDCPDLGFPCPGGNYYIYEYVGVHSATLGTDPDAEHKLRWIPVNACYLQNDLIDANVLCKE